MTEVDFKKITTGNAQMDEILKGGFPANSINIIIGQPGTGKTIFAEQLVFQHAGADDRPILYLTTLSEPVSKILTYLQRFDFYDESKVGTAVHYQDVGFELAQDGIEALVRHIEEAIHSLNPKMVIVDSFKALHDLTDSRQEMRRMLYRLTGMLSAYETTVFLLGEYADDDARKLPEFAIADGIVQFLRNPLSMRDERFLRVVKLRGSGYLEGLHGFRITSAGLDIYPRLISPQIPTGYPRSEERITSGIDGFDTVIGGGFLRGSTTIVAGPTGSGKTTLALQFALAGLKQKERSLYVNFQENPTQLTQLIKQLVYQPGSSGEQGFEQLYTSPVELQIDSIIVQIFRTIKERNIKRVVIDALGDLSMAASDPDRMHDYLYALIQHFAVTGVTSILTYENPAPTVEGPAAGRLSPLSDNIVILQTANAPDYTRELTCVKARKSPHNLRPQKFYITEKGIKVDTQEA